MYDWFQLWDWGVWTYRHRIQVAFKLRDCYFFIKNNNRSREKLLGSCAYRSPLLITNLLAFVASVPSTYIAISSTFSKLLGYSAISYRNWRSPFIVCLFRVRCRYTNGLQTWEKRTRILLGEIRIWECSQVSVYVTYQPIVKSWRIFYKELGLYV